MQALIMSYFRFNFELILFGGLGLANALTRVKFCILHEKTYI